MFKLNLIEPQCRRITGQLIFTALGTFSTSFYRCFDHLALKTVFPIVMVFVTIISGFGLDIVHAGSPESTNVPMLDEQLVQRYDIASSDTARWTEDSHIFACIFVVFNNQNCHQNSPLSAGFVQPL